MSDHVRTRIRSILSAYVELPADDFDMSKDLATEYALDSTEMSEIVKTIEQEFAIEIARATRQAWSTGEDISKFVKSAATEVAASAP